MSYREKIRVHLWDQMILIAFALALFYSIFDSVLYIFMQYDVDFFQRLLGPDISAIWSRLTILCLFAIFGSHAQFTINKRLAAERAMRESEQRYRRIIETTPDGYFEVDMDGNFTYFNDSMSDILGYSRSDITGKSLTAYLDEPNAKKVMDAMRQVRATAESVTTLGWTVKRRDGSKRYVESSIALVTDGKGHSTGYSVFLRDVTERRRAQALRQAQKAAEAANRSKSRFLANMSHEIRTPLNSIIGLIELVLETDLRPDQREDLGVVISSAYALLALINNLLDFSKIEAGKFELEESPLHIRDFTQATMRMMAMKTQAKGLELAYRVAADVPDDLIGDPGRLRQVLLNLIENSVKFTSRGEVIVQVTLKNQTDREAYLTFVVQDTGIGIPKEKQHIIFNAFQQLDAKISSQYGGTGLGLAVASQLVELMGGHIDVDSEPGRGSRFRFTARFGLVSGADTRAAETRAAFSDVRILVVDDNAASGQIIREILADWQMVPVFASGGTEAQRLISTAAESGAPLDVVLIDSDMPGSDGFSLAGWIKEKKLHPEQVIMMLTFPYLKRKAELAELGVKVHIVKPVHPPELCEAIEIVRGLKPRRPEARPAVTPAKAEIADRPLRILVAEDTPFNQTFIMRLLEKNGYHAALAENGRQVLEALARDTFDLVLMDVQMPEMDGFEATREIRRLEKQTGTHIPIVAMTAYAIKGDRERCLAAGMDEYVSKPIASEKLFEAIHALLPRESQASAAAAADEPLFDKRALLRAFDQDWALFKELVEIFSAEYPRLLADLRQALQAQDAQTLSRSAHSLKGMLRNFLAETAASSAFKLEQDGKAYELEGLEAVLEQLEKQTVEVERHLRDIVSQKA